MVELNQVEKNCLSCQAGLKASDRFCRQCGVTQAMADGGATSGLRNETGARAEAVTSDLIKVLTARVASETNVLPRPVSRPLLQALTESVARWPTMSDNGKITRNVVTALMSAPIWLMIILLSPFDAWTATKAMTKQV